MRNYWFSIDDEYSDLAGEEFFVQCNNKEEAFEIVTENFPNEKVKCYGWVDDDTAETMGLDTY